MCVVSRAEILLCHHGTDEESRGRERSAEARRSIAERGGRAGLLYCVKGLKVCSSTGSFAVISIH